MDGWTQPGEGADCGPEHNPAPDGRAANEDAGLFDATRVAPAERIGRLLSTLEGEVIPRLLDLHTLRPAAAAVAGFEPDDVARLAGGVIGADPEPTLARLTALLDGGAPLDVIALQLLGPAARELGRMWDDDECSFADVTVGVGRLQQWMRQVMPPIDPSWAQAPVGGRRVLLAAPQGEQHTFGLSLVSDFFRNAGWDVTVELAGEQSHPVDTVGMQWFDAVGFSVGNHTRLDWLAAMIAAVRNASKNPALVVMAGGPIFKVHPEYAAQLEADLICPDGHAAPAQADALLLRRMRSN
jgi:methanogenic corrinoid protein MtbC1